MSNKNKISNEHLYRMISDDAMMGFLCFNTDSKKCIYANKLGHDILELGLEFNLESLELESLFPEKSNKKDFRSLNHDMLTHEGLYQSILIKKQNGHNFISNVGVKKIHINNEEHLLLMVQDTTLQSKLQREVGEKQMAIKVAYEEVLKQNEQLKELDKAKSRFISLTTHELRTPLSAMVATSEVLKLKLYDNQEQLEDFIETIYTQGLHLMDLINDVLDFSKIQAGHMDYFVQEFDLAAQAKELIELNQGIANKDNISIEFKNNCEGDEAKCYYDDLRIKQVITNIMSNAIKYNSENGSVIVEVSEDSKEVTLSIQDSGKGIPADSIDKVFDEFETLGKVALHHEGTGLGMPISKQLMIAMGGSINLSSEEGVGTKFWIKIPKQKVLSEENYGERPDLLGDLAA